MSAPAANRPVVIWLVVVYLSILVMVVIGGITRLTGSGLSMVEWRPLMGALPPLSEADWQALFAEYQRTPQYQEVNHWMTLGDFERIFWWEYIHRLWGRLIGVIFFVPWLVFTLQRRLRGRLALQTLGLFVLGGLQGFLGWYMVQSGLVDVPAVSHLRLAAHLSLAFLLGMWILWIVLAQRDARPAEPSPSGLQVVAWALVVLLAAQIVWGAFMAGTRAGYMFATFPTLNGQWVPATLTGADSLARALVYDPGSIHFVHRTLGYVVGLVGLAFWVAARHRLGDPRRRKAVDAFAAVLVAQVVLGVITVIEGLPIWLAALHQAGAYVLLSAAVWVVFQLRAGRVVVAGMVAEHGASSSAAEAARLTR
jgi:heme a synthase